MESNLDPRQALRAADRAQAAPYLQWRTPSWVPPVVGVMAALFVLGVHLADRADVPTWLSLVPSLLVVSLSWLMVVAVYRAHGAWPTGPMPPEIARWMGCYGVGAVVVAVLLFILAAHAPWGIALLSGFVMGWGGMVLSSRSYDRAQQRLERRLS